MCTCVPVHQGPVDYTSVIVSIVIAVAESIKRNITKGKYTQINYSNNTVLTIACVIRLSLIKHSYIMGDNCQGPVPLCKRYILGSSSWLF